MTREKYDNKKEKNLSKTIFLSNLSLLPKDWSIMPQTSARKLYNRFLKKKRRSLLYLLSARGRCACLVSRLFAISLLSFFDLLKISIVFVLRTYIIPWSVGSYYHLNLGRKSGLLMHAS